MTARANTSVMWDVFDRTDLLEKKARCRQCGDLFSYKTTTGNLKTHLKIKHNDVYLKVIAAQAAGESRVTIDNEEAGSTVKFSSEIWRQFEHDEDEARCSTCQEPVQNTIEEMRNHLEERHTSLLDDIIAKAQKGLDSDDNAADDENLYTEIVYLEDETRKRKSSTRKRRQSRYEETTKFRPKRDKHVSESSSDEVLKKPQSPDDFEVFISYIRSLLKKVPKEVSPKLHLDIINLIMNATIKAQSQSTGQSIVIETMDDNNINTQNTHRVITVPLHNLIKLNDSANVSLPPLYVSSSNVKYTTANTLSMPEISGQGVANAKTNKIDE